MAGCCGGLTDAILLEAEIAATRRLDWRMALENMTAVLKSLLRLLCNQLRLMQEGGRGEVDGVGDGALRKRLERSPGGNATHARRHHASPKATDITKTRHLGMSLTPTAVSKLYKKSTESGDGCRRILLQAVLVFKQACIACTTNEAATGSVHLGDSCSIQRSTEVVICQHINNNILSGT